MKRLIAAAMLVAFATPAYAQLGGLGGALKKAADKKQALDDLTINDAEERQLGENVSTEIRKRFGVVQDAAVHKYVSLVGMAMAQQSDRPNLPWTFIVLDTDGVNAFASPGGFVHITRGALGLIRNEAELAGVLGHELAHVVRKHTVNAIQKNKAIGAGINSAAGGRSELMNRMAKQAYEQILENSFDRGDELDADKVGIQLAQKIGYANALPDFLARLAERNQNQAERNGMFASHPETKERIDRGRQLGVAAKTTALAESRYTSTVKYDAPALTSIAVVQEGSAGLAGGGKAAPKEEEKKEEPKKRGFGLSALRQTTGQEKQSTQVSASGGARGLGADRAAKGGSNPTIVRVAVTPAELDAFKKGIA